MEPILRRAIARVEVVEAGRTVSRGTGALVSPDSFLTALHVVADCVSEEPRFHRGEVRLTFPGHVCTVPVTDALWDRAADWILLRCGDPPSGARPMPIAEAAADRSRWETFGFPDDVRNDGIAHTGTVKHHGEQNGVPVFQLFSEEAAAAGGGLIPGLSGAPVIVDGALVAILRSALLSNDRAVFGTLYGCPISGVLDRAGDRLPIPDPCRGLPGLRRRPLPPAPFNYLNRYTSAEAEIFFGRNREIRELYNRLTSDDGARIVLLYGQTGVGKSSFLDAGVVPRLEWTHTVRYVRRDSGRSLVDTVRQSIAPEGAGAAQDVPTLWRHAEKTAGRPLIVILDQVEEIYTQPSDRDDEIDTLLEAVGPLVDSGERMGGRLILGFRKEWFPEIQKALEQASLDYGRVFLESLDRASIVEVITSLTATPRLRERYCLDLAPGLAEVIADDLREDRGSPIAPTLQILLSKMWQHATAESPSRPAFTVDLYHRLKRQGLLLGDFVDQQLARLAAIFPSSVASGLALDVMRYHTTPSPAAQQRSMAELGARYRRQSTELPKLVAAMKDLFLLVDASGDQAAAANVTRLSHDTLAPLVRQRFDESDRPGQRAYRILENRAVEWTGGREGPALDSADLKVVEDGLSGMRALDSDEERLLDASIKRRASEEKRRRLFKSAAAAAMSLIVLFAVVAGILWRRAETQRRATVAGAVTMYARNALDTDPTLAALLLAELRGYPAPEDGERTAQRTIAQHISTAILRATDGAPIRSIAVSPDGQMFLTGSEDGGVVLRWLNERTEAFMLDPSVCPSKSGQKPVLIGAAYDPAGTKVVTYSADATARLWTFDGKCLGALPHENTVRSAAFNHDGTLLATTVDRTNRVLVWSTNGATNTPAYELLHNATVQSALFGAPSSAGQRLLTVAGGILRIWTLTSGARPEERRVPQFANAYITSATFDSDGIGIAAVTNRGAILLSAIDRLDDQPRVRESDSSAPIRTVEFCPDKTCAAVNRGDEVQVVALSGHQQSLRHPSFVNVLAFSADGKTLATASEDGMARLWFRTRERWEGPSVLRGHSGPISGVDFTRDGRHVITASLDGTTRIWPTTPTEPVRIGDLRANITHAAISLNGRHAAVVSDDSVLSVVRLEDEGVYPVSSLPPGAGTFERLDISSNGSHVLAVSASDFRLWRIGADSNWQPVEFNDPPSERIIRASFTHDGSQIVITDSNGVVSARPITVDGLGAAIELFRLPVVTDLVTISFAKDLRRVLTGYRDGTTVWRATAFSPGGLERDVQLPPHGDTPTQSMFSEDGARVLMKDASLLPSVISSNGRRTPIELGYILRAAAFKAGASQVIGISPSGAVLRWRIAWTELLEALDAATDECLEADQRTQYLGETLDTAVREVAFCLGRKPAQRSRSGPESGANSVAR